MLKRKKKNKNTSDIKEGVSKASFCEATPKSPRGDLLKTNDIKSPPCACAERSLGGVWG
jgi:hypothetical protein